METMLSNGDNGTPQATVDDGDVSYKQKYRDLKRRLKYLVYENECFEKDIRESQMKLLQVSREKSFLLDQLMVHETLVLSENSDVDSTDYSSEEERSSTYSELLSRKPAVSNKLPGPVTSSPKTKGGVASRGGATKKQSVRGSSAKHTTSKGTKGVAKATVTSVTTPKLIVSLPIGQSQMPRPPKLIPSVSTKGVNITSDKKPSSIGGKGKGKRMSSSSSSGSSSSGSSNGESGSSDSSDSEEPMDTSEIPPPPPLLVDSAVSMATTMTHPLPVQSPIRIMPPNKLTSLNTIPLLSPSNSSPNITTKLLLSGTKQATPTIGVTPLVNPTTSVTKPSSLVATIGGNTAAVNISAFHVVKQSHDGNKT